MQNSPNSCSMEVVDSGAGGNGKFALHCSVVAPVVVSSDDVGQAGGSSGADHSGALEGGGADQVVTEVTVTSAIVSCIPVILSSSTV